jgi:hypothetical protein
VVQSVISSRPSTLFRLVLTSKCSFGFASATPRVASPVRVRILLFSAMMRVVIFLPEKLGMSAGTYEDNQGSFPTVIQLVSQQEIATNMALPMSVPVARPVRDLATQARVGHH